MKMWGNAESILHDFGKSLGISHESSFMVFIYTSEVNLKITRGAPPPDPVPT